MAAALSRVRFLRGRWALDVSIAILACAVLAAIFGPLLAPHDPNSTSLLAVFESPSSTHLLGTDGSGRDIFSRLLVGARSSIFAPAIVMVLAVTMGTVLAVVAGWRGGATDKLIARVMDILFAFPGLILAILGIAIFGKGLTVPVIALGIVYIPFVGRIVRAAVIRERSLPYIAALDVQGLPAISIIRRHLLPNILPTIFAQAVIAFSYAMIDLATICFLGLGVQPPEANWGAMVGTGLSSIVEGHFEESLFAGLCIVLVIVAANVLADQIHRDDEVRPL